MRKCFFMPGWTTLKKMVRFQKRKSFLVESQLAYKCYQLIKNGEVLEKYHLSSKGHKKQFFKIIDAKQLRWCDNEKDINKLSACKVYELSQIKGLVFGKVTETFRKKANAGLEPWLCFSLMMDKRSFDLGVVNCHLVSSSVWLLLAFCWLSRSMFSSMKLPVLLDWLMRNCSIALCKPVVLRTFLLAIVPR